MRRALAAVLLVAAAIVASISQAHAERRVALVIGNSDYRHTTPLQNPRNDASDVAAVLRRLGFTVVEGVDLDKDGMERRIREFALALDGADVGLFFYAGHGLQVGGKNYLAPVDAALRSETDLDFEAIHLNLVLRQLERNARLSLVFLDACRDNPMATTLARSLKARSRSVSIGRGLAKVEKVVGMMIAFATQPGNVALDGEGRNSPFTKALLRNIETEGATISDTMIQVRNDVVAATDGKQVPWENSSLMGKFYFKPKSVERRRVGGAAGYLDVPGTTFDYTFWTSIRDSDNPVLYEDYLKRFPGGVFRSIAKAKLDRLRSVGGEDKGTEPTAGRSRANRDAVEQARAELKDDAARPDAEPRETAIDLESARLQLVRDTQTALKRLDCYAGAIDGKWGRGSRAAMERFNRVSGLNLSPEPSASSLDRIKSSYFLKGRRCVATATKRVTPSKQPKQVKRTSPKKQAKRTSPKKQVKRTSSKKQAKRSSPKKQVKRSKPKKRVTKRRRTRNRDSDVFPGFCTPNTEESCRQ